MSRRRLLLWSAPVALLVVVAILKLTSMTLASRWAATDFTRGDVDALRSDVAVLEVFDVVDPATTSFASGALAVLEDRLDDAESQFAASGGSCPALVNLVFVRETLGDRAVAGRNGPGAIDRYRAALGVVVDAPANCFEENADPDPERRAVRADSEDRLKAKLALLERPLPPLPPPPAAPPPPPAAPPPTAGGSDAEQPDAERRLNPGDGDPLDRLRQLLEDAAAARGAP